MHKPDVAIINGEIIDGTGELGFRGHVIIDGGRIAAVVDDRKAIPEARRLIDARGRAVTPGFIDPHTHVGLYLLESPMQEVYLRQGVTSLVTGNCGSSVIPGPLSAHADYRGEPIAERLLERGFEWEDLPGYVAALRHVGGTGPNAGVLLGHGYLRWHVMGRASLNRPMTDPEMGRALELVDEGMSQGALGMSTGLSYSPGLYADMDEVVELLGPVREHGGVYATHIRYEGGYGFANPSSYARAVEEALETARRARVRLQISHLDMGVTADCYEIVAQARAAGQDVTVDTIPKSTGYVLDRQSTVKSLMGECESFFNRSVEAFEEVLAKPGSHPDVAAELRDSGFLKQSPGDVLIANSGDRRLEGRTVEQAAGILGVEPNTYDVVLALLADDRFTGGFMFGTRRDDRKPPYPLPGVMAHPFLCPGSDVIGRDVVDPFARYDVFRAGTFPIFLRYCLKRGVILEESIRRMTSLPAHSMGISERGLLREGYRADVLIFDPFRLRYPILDDLNYDHPARCAEGLDWSFVNGAAVIEEGYLTGRRPGEWLGA